MPYLMLLEQHMMCVCPFTEGLMGTAENECMSFSASCNGH